MSDVENRNHYGYLDYDCMIRVLSFVSQSDLFELSVLNSAINKMIHSTAVLWTHLILESVIYLEFPDDFRPFMKYIRRITMPEDAAEWPVNEHSEKSLFRFLRNLENLSSVKIDCDLYVQLQMHINGLVLSIQARKRVQTNFWGKG